MKTLISSLLNSLNRTIHPLPFRHSSGRFNGQKYFAFTAWSECDSFLYIGTNHGVFRKNKLNGDFKFLTQKNSLLPSNQVTSIICTKEGLTFIGTQKGIVRCDNNKALLMTSVQLSLPDQHITALAVDSNDDVWMGTANGGLWKSTDDKINSFSLLPINTRNKNIYSISVDPQGSVWVVFQNGVIEYFQKGNTPVHRTIPLLEENQSSTAGSFLLTISNQGTFLTDGNSFRNLSEDSTFRTIHCAYYNPAYNRMVLCEKDGILVFRMSDPLSGYRKWSYADFVQAIAFRGNDKEITTFIKHINKMEQEPFLHPPLTKVQMTM